MQTLDSTIANVALPYMQGSLSASSDQISWVLTSYIIAAAIMTAPVGWIAGRIGLRRLFIIAMAGFTVASMLCGAAQTLPEMVLFRTIQGVFGAALVPLSQTIMIEIYPLEERGRAMAMWGMGVMIGPVIGPVLGGYLTEVYNWRYVFYVNLPFGILALAGMMAFLPRGETQRRFRFDGTGFAILGIALAAFQLFLDRGQDKDWFGSNEIVAYAVVGGLALYLFIVHMLTASEPLFPRAMFRDRNLVACFGIMFATAMILLATLSLLAPWLQTLAGYPVEAAGLTMGPQGAATMIGMQVSGRLYGRFDPRLIMATGVAMMTYSLMQMTHWTPDVAQMTVIENSAMRGAGLGLIFIPMNVLAFSTLRPELRAGGAAMMSLVRNVGSAVGVSVFTTLIARNTQTMHAVIASGVDAFNPALRGTRAGHVLDLATRQGVAAIDAIVGRQALIVAYLDDFKLMMLLAMPVCLLLLLLRVPRRSAPVAVDAADAASAAH